VHAKLLVPLDGMPLAETAIPLATHLARLLRGQLELLRVVPEGAPAGAAAEARRYLEAVHARCAENDVQVELRVLRGDPAQCIVGNAATTRAELIVMTTHARSGVRRAVLGSVAEAVVARTTVPTLLVRGGPVCQPHLRTLLVALDSNCAAPLKSILALAQAACSRIVLLHVVPAEETAIWQWQRGEVLEEPQTVAIARQQLGDLAAHFEENGIPTHVRVQLGEVAPTIVSVAREVEADLIVMATHARTGAQRAVVGSVADAVVHKTHTAVLLTRQIPMHRRYSSAL
jgi:nucleotide-binding universal stress UspA family protein